MLSIVARAFGPPSVLQLEELPDPTPLAGEVRVRVHAAGVNPYDTYMRAGGYAISPELPYVPGADAAGVIDALGDGVQGWKVGDRVYISGTATHRAYGAYSSMVVCRVHQIHRLPDRLTFAQGAAINVPYATAWRAVFQRAQAERGETIFIHGASGAVGLAAVQMARAAGLTVIGTASTPEGTEEARAQGAHHVLNHRASGYLDELTTLTGGGPNIIIEMLANQNLDHDLGIIAKFGRIVIVGSRGRVEIDPRRIMSKEATVMGTAFWNLSEEEVSAIHAAMAASLANGALSPVIGRELPLAEAAQAHERVMQPGARGKIVLTV
ncbi:MAG: NADPH:quinone reductase [Acidobacteria bacterium]|nr:NADPH:quinone reductase [Acidobacteriota bacterium]